MTFNARHLLETGPRSPAEVRAILQEMVARHNAAVGPDWQTEIGIVSAIYRTGMSMAYRQIKSRRHDAAIARVNAHLSILANGAANART